MNATIIVACSQNRTIGRGGKVPWHMPADLKRFRKNTMNHSIVMGRVTADSLPKPLPGRENIVMSRGIYKRNGFRCSLSKEDIESYLGEQEFFVIGGEQIYKLFLPNCKKILLTRVEDQVEGDTFFPELNETEWTVFDKVLHPRDEKHYVDMTFMTLLRTKS